MKHKVIFLDRDGVINKPAQPHDYIKCWEEFEFLPGAIEGLKILYNLGYKLVIVTNQRGIARGLLTWDKLNEIHEKMQEVLKQNGVIINHIFVCPHDEADNCDCRKPKDGLLRKIEEYYEVDKEHSYMIGDSESDTEAGKRFGVKTITVNNNILSLAEYSYNDLLNFSLFLKKRYHLKRYITIKSLLDKSIALTILSVILPFLFLIALALKLYDFKGPVIYKRHTVGRNMLQFDMLKFRTMVNNADVILENWLNKNPELKNEFYTRYKLKDDKRIHILGKFLRKTSLDELPQLFNILLGEMSLIGPRPVTVEEIELYYKDKAQDIFSIRPGLIGLWQVTKRSEINSYQERVNIDLFYVKNISLKLDLYILLKSLEMVITRKGAY